MKFLIHHVKHRGVYKANVFCSPSDLDDALSVEQMPDGRYKVAVHIADVSYFVNEKTELDVAAQDRATSVYLVQKVIPMLPR